MLDIEAIRYESILPYAFTPCLSSMHLIIRQVQSNTHYDHLFPTVVCTLQPLVSCDHLVLTKLDLLDNLAFWIYIYQASTLPEIMCKAVWFSI